MSGQMRCQYSLQSLTEVFEHMEPICTLDGLRSATGCRRGRVAAAIPTHQLDFWMRFHPSFGRFCLAIRQEINDVVALQVYQDGAEFSPTTESEIIYPKLCYLFSGCCWKDHDTAKDRCWRRLNSETLRESGSQLSTGRQAKRLKGLAETDGEPCPRQHEGGKAFRKDLPDAVSSVTKEPAHMQDELHTEACAGQVCHHASILAMAALGRTKTERTARSHVRRNHLNHQQIITHAGRCNL